MRVKKIFDAVILTIIKASRVCGTKRYMKLYVNFLRKRGADIDAYKGDGFYAPDVWFDSTDYHLIKIGEGTTIASNSIILTHDYSIRKALAAAGLNPEGKNYKLIKKVTIGKNVFIGARSLIMPGTIIGDYSIIAAGSVVRGIIPEHSVWGGVPAKNICSVEEYANKHYLAKDYRV